MRCRVCSATARFDFTLAPGLGWTREQGECELLLGPVGLTRTTAISARWDLGGLWVPYAYLGCMKTGRCIVTLMLSDRLGCATSDVKFGSHAVRLCMCRGRGCDSRYKYRDRRLSPRPGGDKSRWSWAVLVPAGNTRNDSLTTLAILAERQTRDSMSSLSMTIQSVLCPTLLLGGALGHTVRLSMLALPGHDIVETQMSSKHDE